MTKKTDDDAAKTGGEHAETRILTPEHDAHATRIMSDPNAPPQTSSPPDPFSSTTTIGDYRIIRKLGEGGMGVVYEAEQQHPRRLVALKVIRGGLHADDYHVKMFEREIQALARLKHPGIASIYESGLAEDGQIFFAMELVHGTTLTEFVEDAKLSGTEQMADVDTQLELFSKICDVVSYAHQRGVIHRDLKPQNILVTADADEPSTGGSSSGKVGVKILDFGLARISDPDIAGDTTDLSQVGQIKGTLLYMSPEQVRARPDDIDVRSDVYSLGVMLYEMLSGRMPYDISQASLPEALRIICEEPPRSLRDADIASAGRSGRIDRDVETIVLKALEKEPDRRYQSVSAMMDDIDRYLTNQPILARPPSTYYQFRKLVARHRAAFASIGVIFLMLLGFGIAMAAQSVRIANERDKAEQARNEAEEQKAQAEAASNNEAKQRVIAEDNFKRAEDEKTKAEAEQKRAEEEKAKAEKAQKAEAEQRKIAETNLIEARNQKAVAEKQTGEAKFQKSLADEQKVVAENEASKKRKLLYISQVNLAAGAYDDANVAQKRQLLDEQIPVATEEDLRGFEWYFLWKASHQGLWTSLSPEGSVYRPVFSPSGEYVAVAHFELVQDRSTFRTEVLRTADGKVVAVIPNSRHPILFSRDGNELFVISSDGQVNTFSLSRRTSESTGIRSVPNTDAWPSSNLTQIAVWGEDGALQIWDPLAKKKIATLDVAVSDYKSMSSEVKSIFNVKFSDGGRILAVLGERNDEKGSLTFWDTTSGKFIGQFVVGLADSIDMQIDLSPDGKCLATFGKDGNVRMWDLENRTELWTMRVIHEVNRYGLQNYRVKFSPDGGTLATTYGRKLRLWDIKTRTELESRINEIDSVSDTDFAPDGKTLVTSSTRHGMTLWRAPSLETPIRSTGGSTISLDGSMLVTVKDRALHLTDLRTGGLVAKLDPRVTSPEKKFWRPQFSPDGTWLGALSVPGNSLEIWRLPTLERHLILNGEPVTAFSFSADGSLLATSFGDGPAQVWDLPSGALHKTFEKGSEPRFSPVGHKLGLIVGKDIEIVDVDRPAPKKAWKFQRVVFAWQFSPDGKWLAAAPDSENLVLLNVETGEKVDIPGSQSGMPTAIAFSPDGKRLAVAGSSAEVTIWDTETKREVQRIPILSMSLQFGADNRSLLVRTYPDNVVRILRGATDEEIAKQRRNE